VNNELLTAFRSEVQLPSHATARRVFGQAIRRRPRRVTRTRVVIAVAVVVAVAVGAGLSTTLGGASPDKDIAARQQVVDRAVKHVQDAFGDRRITSAELYGGVLSVKLAASNPPATVIGGFEARILANVVDEDLRAAGLSEIDACSRRATGAPFTGRA